MMIVLENIHDPHQGTSWKKLLLHLVLHISLCVNTCTLGRQAMSKDPHGNNDSQVKMIFELN